MHLAKSFISVQLYCHPKIVWNQAVQEGSEKRGKKSYKPQPPSQRRSASRAEELPVSPCCRPSLSPSHWLPDAHMEPITNKARLLYIWNFPHQLDAFFNCLLMCVCTGWPDPRFHPSHPAPTSTPLLRVFPGSFSSSVNLHFFPLSPHPTSY